jgi:hypothetical protein
MPPHHSSAPLFLRVFITPRESPAISLAQLRIIPANYTTQPRSEGEIKLVEGCWLISGVKWGRIESPGTAQTPLFQGSQMGHQSHHYSKSATSSSWIHGGVVDARIELNRQYVKLSMPLPQSPRDRSRNEKFSARRKYFGLSECVIFITHF